MRVRGVGPARGTGGIEIAATHFFRERLVSGGPGCFLAVCRRTASDLARYGSFPIGGA